MCWLCRGYYPWSSASWPWRAAPPSVQNSSCFTVSCWTLEINSGLISSECFELISVQLHSSPAAACDSWSWLSVSSSPSRWNPLSRVTENRVTGRGGGNVLMFTLTHQTHFHPAAASGRKVSRWTLMMFRLIPRWSQFPAPGDDFSIKVAPAPGFSRSWICRCLRTSQKLKVTFICFNVVSFKSSFISHVLPDLSSAVKTLFIETVWKLIRELVFAGWWKTSRWTASPCSWRG